MKIIIKMNLSPIWVSYLEKHSIEAKHWSQVGNRNDPDSVILAWAKQHQFIVFTNDLDFGAILALSKGKTPSVFQLRTQDLLPQSIGKIVIGNLERFRLELRQGALMGSDYIVKASGGHIRELAKDGEENLGFDSGSDRISCRFVPRNPQAKKRIAELKKLVKQVETVILATDEDREGEIITWHLKDALKLRNLQRVNYREITTAAVQV